MTTHKAHIVDHGIFKSGKGDPMALLTFSFLDELGNPQLMNWFGSFNGGARDVTVKTLIKCGYESNRIEDLCRYNEADPGNPLPMKFDNKKEFELVIENEEYNGKVNKKIKFINLPGENRFENLFVKDKKEVVRLTAGLNLMGDFVMGREKLGIQLPQDDKDIPF